MSEDQDFLARVAPYAPRGGLGGLTPEQENTALDLIERVDTQWTGRIRLSNLGLNVASYFPWRRLHRAPIVFAIALFPSAFVHKGFPSWEPEEENTYKKYKSLAHRQLSDYVFMENLIPHDTSLMHPYEDGPIDEFIAYVLTRCYDEETGAGRWVGDSIPKLQQLGNRLQPEDQEAYLEFIDTLMSRSSSPYDSIYYEYARRRLFRYGVEDLLLPLFVGRLAHFVDMGIDISTSRGGIPHIARLHEKDPNYEQIISVVLRVTGYWDNPRIIQRAIDAATALSKEQIELAQAVESVEEVIYTIGKETYERAIRRLRVTIGHRFYAPGQRLASEAIAEARELASHH